MCSFAAWFSKEKKQKHTGKIDMSLNNLHTINHFDLAIMMISQQDSNLREL